MIEKILDYFGDERLLAIILYALIVGVINLIFPLWLGVGIVTIVYIFLAVVWGLSGLKFQVKDFLCFAIGLIIGIL